MPLTMIKSGDDKIIQSLRGSERLKNKLLSMGFVPGQSISVIKESKNGMILNVKGSRIAVDKGLAFLIQVL